MSLKIHQIEYIIHWKDGTKTIGIGYKIPENIERPLVKWFEDRYNEEI